MSIRVTRRVRSVIDYLAMQSFDSATIVNNIHTSHSALLAFYVPLANLQNRTHRRFEVERFAEWTPPQSSVAVPLGLATVLVGVNKPQVSTLLDRWLDPGPYPCLNVRIVVIDRVQWQRTVWAAHSICKSLCWGRLPQKLYGISMDYQHPVHVDSEFDATLGHYTKYVATVPGRGVHIELEDTKVPLLTRGNRVVDGFLDNESALKVLGLGREVVMRGIGGECYRQPLWSTPTHPNLAKPVKVEVTKLFEDVFDCAPVGDPIVSWLVDEVPNTQIFQIEGQIEEENDAFQSVKVGERMLVERVQKKAQNRYNAFRDDVRAKAYSELRGEELPR